MADTGDGGAIYAGTSTTLELFNGTFSSNSGNSGGAVAILVTVEGTISGCLFENNEGVDGGALYIGTSPDGFTLEGSTFFGNFAGERGR